MCENISYVLVTFEGHCVTVSDILINAFILCTGFCICCLNGWIFFILVRHCDQEDPSNCFIVNLAAADFLIGIFVVYDVFYNILQFKIFIECVLRIGLFISMNLASVLSLVSLTIDRYFKITRPFLYMNKFTRRKTRFVEGLVWTLSVIIGILPFFGWNTKNIFQICNYFGMMSTSYLILIMVIYGLAFVVMVAVYIRVFILAQNHSKDIKATEYHLADDIMSSNRSWKSFRTAFIIVGAFFGCWMPSGIFTMLVLFSDVDKHFTGQWSENVIFTYLLGIGILNSILNPIIYATKVDTVHKRVTRSAVYVYYKQIRNSCRGLQPNIQMGNRRSRDSNAVSSWIPDVALQNPMHNDIDITISTL